MKLPRLVRVLLFLFPLLLSPALGRGAPAWRTWDAGVSEAARLGRPVLVDVYTDWCGWCKRMDRDVYSRADVQEYLARRFVVVKLDAESRAPARYQGSTLTSRSLATRLGATGYPTTVFLGAKGAALGSLPGYIPADRFLQILHYVGDGHAERGQSFDDYLRATRTRGGVRAGAGR